MLKVNVGLSRKLSRDYNSTGFSINLEGEVTAASNDSQAVIEQVKELFDLAEEALNLQIERANSNDPPPPKNNEQRSHYSNGNGRNGHSSNGQQGERRPQNGDSQTEAATNKQVQYLLSIGKRQRMSTNQLEHQIHEILHREVGIYDLTKREAAEVIDVLTSSPAAAGNGSRRY